MVPENQHRACTYLLVPISDATASEVVRGEFYLDAIARKNSDVVPTHLARDVTEHLMSILKLDPEHSVRERLSNGALKDNRIFLGLCQNISLNEDWYVGGLVPCRLVKKPRPNGEQDLRPVAHNAVRNKSTLHARGVSDLHQPLTG